MTNKLRIYTLENLPPEIRAVTFAKCSRSPEPFDVIAKELTAEQSAKFHERWVVGYGHSSVAEHAFLSIALENVSILATKVIEDNRLASYTEKSTRYQIFNKDTYYKPARVMESDLGSLFEETGDLLLNTYDSLFAKTIEFCKNKFPRTDEPEKMYESIIKGRACDILRYFLPTATQTNLGMTINARNLEWAITKLLSHPLAEMREIGQGIKEAGLKITPTLIKHADASEFLKETNQALAQKAEAVLAGLSALPEEPSVKLVEYDKEAENKLVTSLLYHFSNLNYEQVKNKVSSMPETEKQAVIDESLKRRGKFDRPLRELEHVYYTFDILMDYGAFRDLQRHRMCTQTNQAVTIKHGVAEPEFLQELGISDKFKECMDKAAEAYKKIYEKFPLEAQYLVPLAFKKRTLFTLNLRELHHLISLRSTPHGHWSYRTIAQLMYRELERVQPFLAKYIRVNMGETGGHV